MKYSIGKIFSVLALSLAIIGFGAKSEARVRDYVSAQCRLRSATPNADGSYIVGYEISGLRTGQQAFFNLVEPVTFYGDFGYTVLVPSPATNSTIQVVYFQQHIAPGSYSPWINVSNSRWSSQSTGVCGDLLTLP